MNFTAKRIKAGLLAALLALLLAAGLTSCANTLFRRDFLTFLGFDMTDYESELTIGYPPHDGDAALQISAIIGMLTADSVILPEFSDVKTVAAECADSILSYMLGSNYAKYGGNPDALADAREEYPQYDLTVLIPASDFENTVYKNFGGDDDITNQSGTLFTYLSRVKAYTSVGQTQANRTQVEIMTLEETVNTYRMTFCNKLDGQYSPVYMALVIKRDDGTLYIKNLKKIASERVSAPIGE